jgi:hypothetical protein
VEVQVTLPDLHPDQVKAYDLPYRFKAVRCGRRWGKTVYGTVEACDMAIKGWPVGWFAPEYKFIAEAYRDIDEVLDPLKKSASKDGVYTLRGGGRIDFWSLENERAGRSRKYKLVVIDEAAFTKPNMIEIWRRSIRPTLLDYRGAALVLSNTNGISPDNFLWQICNQPEHGFKEYHAPTHNNPYLPPEELVNLEKENHPLVYQQEYLAEFVDWRGVAFFSLTKLLVNDLPVPLPKRCDAVFAVVDTATKTGKENDGTAVTYFAVVSHGTSYKLVILDWDIMQIQGDLLETWLPTVFQQLQALSKECGARMGSLGAHIEDKASGMVLIQQAVRRGWPATAINSKLTSVGKDERAISVSGYVYREMVKMSARAYDKTVTYKGDTRNQFLSQVIGYRVGSPKEAGSEDDLLDTFCYGVAIALGNQAGF